ncbi:MAG: hypothetical protein E4G94_10930 [ANME-2 cluster archaeon]|nr:MAG: hypothetical protein E4G94_10930 [ANME-2 cluster archaeon]HUW68221.1 hypothetical protein [Candidatus Nanoarchaeia archaeon]
MTYVKDAPRTSTTFMVRSDSNSRISHSRDPFYELMRRLFQEEKTAARGQKFLMKIEERQRNNDPIKTSEWKQISEELDLGKASFYAMRNKLLGAGMISNKNGEYRLSGQFSKDLNDLALWWWTAILRNNPENL